MVNALLLLWVTCTIAYSMHVYLKQWARTFSLISFLVLY